MFGQSVRIVMETKLLTSSSDITVLKAAKRMAKRKVGAVLIVDNDELVGIFTERDALFRVIAKGLDPNDTTLAEVMTPTPQTIDPEKSFGFALLTMYEKGFRHLPVIERGKLVGMVSARNALDPDLEEFVYEAQRRKQILSERS